MKYYPTNKAKNMSMEKLFSVEDKTVLYWMKKYNCMILSVFTCTFRKKWFAWLMIALVIMTNTGKFCPFIKDTIFPPCRHVSEYSIWSWEHHEFWTGYGFPFDSFILLLQLFWYQRILGNILAYERWLWGRLSNLFHKSCGRSGTMT